MSLVSNFCGVAALGKRAVLASERNVQSVRFGDLSSRSISHWRIPFSDLVDASNTLRFIIVRCASNCRLKLDVHASRPSAP